jgi:hypothetical protein
VAGANNVIGGNSAADRNVIGNAGAGSYNVFVSGATASGNQIIGNWVGLNAAGTTAFTGSQDGITLYTGTANTTVQNNVLSGASGVGVYLSGAGTGNVLTGNDIGLTPAGTATLGTPVTGIRIDGGNTTTITANRIGSASQNGILLASGVDGTVVQGNIIGTDAAGTATWGTGRSGIQVNGATHTRIGGTGVGEGNVIACANSSAGGYDGISVASGTGNAILGNSIYGLGGSNALAIDLGTSGSNANDIGDGDTGANNLQNFPVLTLAKTNGSSQIEIRGTLDSTAGSYFRLEFFAQPANGSSMAYLGFVNVATDGAGTASFANTFAAAVPVGCTITATATLSNAGYTAYTDTSELSAALDAGTTPVNTVPGATTLTEDVSGAITGLSVVDGGVTALTTSLSVLNGTLTVSLAGGATISSGTNGSAALTLSGTTAQVNAALATLAYLGQANFNGSDTLTMLSTDASTLSDIDTVALTVSAANDAPVLAAIAPALGTITEDQTAHGGQTVASFIGASITDVDAGAVQGIAITGLSSGTGTWQYSTDGGSSWTNVGPVSGTAALLLRASDSIRFVPDGLNAASGSITYRAWDQSSGGAGTRVDSSANGGTTAFGTTTDTATITVTAVNDAPVLAASAPTLTSITEDETANAGQTVASFLGTSVSDVDTGAVRGIAITGLVAGNGSWQYSLDGGSSWAAVGSVADISALLLSATDSIRFVPDAQNATAGSLTYRAWDQSAGSAGSLFDASSVGGATPFSSGTATASISVSAVNDAPVLTPIAPVLATIDETDIANPGQTVSSFIGGSIGDVDSGAVPGIAITGADAGNGRWQFSTDGGASWLALGAVSGSAALLLRADDAIRFVPDGANGTTGSITYRAWDQTAGTAGSTLDTGSAGGNGAFSSATDTASITVDALNTAPVLTPAAPMLAPLTEDQVANAGQTVASFTGGSIRDVDAGALQGIATTGLAPGNGSWQFSTDGGAHWAAIGPVSDGAALLLRDTDAERFVPDGANGTTGTLTYRAWDRSLGLAGDRADAGTQGGATAFSAATDTATIVVTDVADAPVIAGTATAFDVAENTTAVTTLVATDVDRPGQAPTWSIAGGVDAARFAIDAVTGALRFIVAPDFEAPTAAAGGQVYRVTVQIDDGGLVDARALAVTVTPVNDNAPAFSSPGDGAQVRIDATVGATAVTQLHASDADLPAQPVRYAIVGGADADRFTLDALSGALAFKVAPDAARVYDVLVEASDGQRATVQRLSIAVPAAAAPVAGPGTAPDVASAHDATTGGTGTSSASGAATAGTTAPARAAAPLASKGVVNAAVPAIDAPVAPRSPVGQTDAGRVHAIALGAAPQVEPVSRGLAAFTLPSHRAAPDVTLLALDVLALGAPANRADGRTHVSVDLGTASAEAPLTESQTFSPSTITLGIALSIGVIGWASRGAALMASVLVASPAWGSYDLLPVLRRRTEDADWGDDESPDDAPLDETDLTPLDASAGPTRRDHDILELH